MIFVRLLIRNLLRGVALVVWTMTGAVSVVAAFGALREGDLKLSAASFLVAILLIVIPITVSEYYDENQRK